MCLELFELGCCRRRLDEDDDCDEVAELVECFGDPFSDVENKCDSVLLLELFMWLEDANMMTFGRLKIPHLKQKQNKMLKQ